MNEDFTLKSLTCENTFITYCKHWFYNVLLRSRDKTLSDTDPDIFRISSLALIRHHHKKFKDIPLSFLLKVQFSCIYFTKLKIFNQLHSPSGQEIILKMWPIPSETCCRWLSCRRCGRGDRLDGVWTSTFWHLANKRCSKT